MSTFKDDTSFAALFEAAPKQGMRRRVSVGEVLDLEVVRVGKTEVFVSLDAKSECAISLDQFTNDQGRPTVSVGSRVAVRVTAIDRQTGLVELSAVSSEPVVQGLPEQKVDPGLASSVVAGMRVKGKVAGVERFGVFLEFPAPGKPRPERGLIPTSELGTPRGADLRKLFPVGTELDAAVIAIDERGRIRLSILALKSADERREFETYAGAAREKAADRSSGFGKLGDLLKKK